MPVPTEKNSRLAPGETRRSSSTRESQLLPSAQIRMERWADSEHDRPR
jgi:hypothetical protein